MQVALPGARKKSPALAVDQKVSCSASSQPEVPPKNSLGISQSLSAPECLQHVVRTVNRIKYNGIFITHVFTNICFTIVEIVFPIITITIVKSAFKEDP